LSQWIKIDDTSLANMKYLLRNFIATQLPFKLYQEQ
jgi:hypothetical protein